MAGIAGVGEAKPPYAISDRFAGLTIARRAIRFYEEKGLLQPSRTAGYPHGYAPSDRVRLKLISSGQRFGVTLDEVAKRIG